MITTYTLSGTQEKIDLLCQTDVDRWCKRLNCSKEQLTYCVMKVGHSPKAVECFWQMNRDRLQTFFHMIWKEVGHTPHSFENKV
jgi:hypothetical protein